MGHTRTRARCTRNAGFFIPFSLRPRPRRLGGLGGLGGVWTLIINSTQLNSTQGPPSLAWAEVVARRPSPRSLAGSPCRGTVTKTMNHDPYPWVWNPKTQNAVSRRVSRYFGGPLPLAIPSQSSSRGRRRGKTQMGAARRSIPSPGPPKFLEFAN